MLRVKKAKEVTIILLLFLSIVSCKKRTVEPIEPVMVPPTYSQRLMVKNDSGMEIFIMPAPGLIATPIVLNSGDETPLDFIVKRSAVLDESGNPLAHTWGVEIGKGHQYIGMRSIDGVLLIKTPSGEIREYLISLGECWFQNNPPSEDHKISIADEVPQLGVPVIALCE
ncbi:MAG: hypothetical protein ACRENZ_04755 [Thermodesulfobacteriota bacterium]